MASGTFWAGDDAWVSYAGVLYPFKKWTTNRKKNEIDFTNFKSVAGWREFDTGFKTATITLEGPIDSDMHLPFNDDAVVGIVTGLGGGNFATWPCLITEDNLSQDTESGGMGSVTARVVGIPIFTWGT